MFESTFGKWHIFITTRIYSRWSIFFPQLKEFNQTFLQWPNNMDLCATITSFQSLQHSGLMSIWVCWQNRTLERKIHHNKLNLGNFIIILCTLSFKHWTCFEAEFFFLNGWSIWQTTKEKEIAKQLKYENACVCVCVQKGWSKHIRSFSLLLHDIMNVCSAKPMHSLLSP